MIILQKIVLHTRKKEKWSKYNTFILDEEETSLQALSTDKYDSLNKIISLENVRQ